MRLLVSWIVVLSASFVHAAQPPVRYEIRFPDLPGSQTLCIDWHMHTVFSDGLVWPTVRVVEAWRQGLDAIAITDHIEYQPHKDDIPTRHNRPYELALPTARAHNVLLARGAELTRDTPPGHYNVTFVNDAAAVDRPELLDAIREAVRQGAFVVWNHHDWKGPEKGNWEEFQEMLYKEKLLHGIEVANGDSYYPRAHRWCLEKKLTMMGTTDAHEPELRLRSLSGDHRTMTLALAKERTLDSIHEALKARRTIVWWKDKLIGPEEHLRQLFEASVRLLPANAQGKTSVMVEVVNDSEADLKLTRSGAIGPPECTLPAGARTLLRITASEADKGVELKYTVDNMLIAPETGLPVVLKVPAKPR